MWTVCRIYTTRISKKLKRHGETVSNFAAEKYGTVSNVVVTSDLIFYLVEQSHILQLQKYGTVSNFDLTCQNSLKFCDDKN